MSKKLFSKVFILLLVVGLLFAVAPTKQAQAATSVSTAAELTAAIAGSETEITVTADISVGPVSGHAFSIPSGRTITLDLNGFVISAETSNGGVFYNVGSLTIVDNSVAKGGTIINTNTTQTSGGDSPKSAISNNGQLTVNAGVTVAGPAVGHGSWGSPNFNPAYGIDNLGGGDVIVNGATISGAYGLRNFANVDGTTITINNGTITGRTGIAMQSFGTNVGTLIISGNTTITAEKSAIYAAGVTQYNQIVINGGTFSGESVDGTVCVVYGSLTINGGTFTGRNDTYSLNNYYAVGNVTAGTFNGNIYGGESGDGKTTFAPSAGKQIIVYGAIEGIVDGAGNVVLNPAVHNVTQNTYFSTIQAAVTASADGDVINVAPGTYDIETLVVPHPLSIIGAGDTTIVNGKFQLTNAGSMAGTYLFQAMKFPVTNSSITVTDFTNIIDEVKVENVTFDTNKDKTARAIGTGPDNVSYKIEKFTVLNSRFYSTLAIYLTGDIGAVEITGNEFHVTDTHWSAYNAININQSLPASASVDPAGTYIIQNNQIFVPGTAFPSASAITNQAYPGSFLAGKPGGKELTETGNTLKVGDGAPITDQSLFIKDSIAVANATLKVHNVTQDKWYTTIQAAINAAADGNTIEVAAGSYAESIDINKSINLIGAGRDLVTLTGTGTGENAVIDISVSNVTVQGFKIVAIDRKTVRITAATTNVQIKDNRLVGAANPELANNFTLLETSGNQAGHLITGNIFEANLTSQVVYYNPTTNGITFTGNTFLGTTKPGGVGFVLESLLGTYDISTNDFTALGGNPYAMMGLPGLTPTAMNTVFVNNTFPTGYAVVGTDIMIPPTKMLMDPATFATTDTCTGTHEVIVKVQEVTDLVSYYLDMEYDEGLITVTNVENLTLDGQATPGNTWANGVINFGWYNPSGGGTPPTYKGNVDLVKITFKSNGLAGTGAFTILPTSALEEWPNAFGIPFEITGGASVSFGSIVTNTTQTKSYCDLAVAVAEAAGGDTLRVDANITSNVSITVDKALTLNTNGLTISRTVVTTPNNSFAVVPGGDLTITGGGTITATSGDAIRIAGDATTLAKVTLASGTLYAPNASVAIIGNRSFNDHDTAFKSQFVMTGGSTNETILVLGNGAEADITGGTLTGAAPIMGNGTVSELQNINNGGTKITIGGTATVGSPTLGWVAIYHPQDGELTINGGTIQGYNGIEMKAGDLEITGGTIEGYGACALPTATGNGTTDTGDAILIFNRDGYGAGQLMDVTISGTPTITSTNCYALREYTLSGETSRLGGAAISGGHFTGGTPGAVSFTTVSDANLDLTGGDYSTDPIAYVYDPYGTYLNTDNRWYIAPLPVISSTDFDDQVTLGVETTFDLTITNSIPGTFDMVFTGYPSETQITYNGTTYYCVGDPCVITVPVTLTGVTPVTLPFAITVATAGTEIPATSYAVAVTMHAPAPTYGTTGRDLATLSASVPVTPGFSVSGTVTMQGRMTRAGVPVYLTWENSLGVTYGPSMDTDEAAVNFRLAVNYGGTYTITTLQPRFLNITADLLKQVTLTGDYTFANPLWLRAGNAIWQTAAGVYDNTINVTDAQKVLTTWNTTGGTDALNNSGDVNFDGNVTIKDLTLVGGNMDLTSALAYGETLWIP